MSSDIPPPGCPAHASGPSALRSSAPGHALRLEEVQEADLLQLDGEGAGDPDFYENARRVHGRVAPVALPGRAAERRPRAWLLLAYADNVHVARASSRFVRDSRRWSMHSTLTEDHPLAATLGYRELVAFLDGEEHQRLRQAVKAGLGEFENRGVRNLATRYADQLIDVMSPRGSADLMTEYAQQLPVRVMARLFYGPDADDVVEVPRFVEAAADAMRASPTAADSYRWLAGTLGELVQHRKRLLQQGAQLPHDLPSLLLAHANRLTDAEVVEHLLMILMAGGTPTSDLIGNTLYVILNDDEVARQLRMGSLTHEEAVGLTLWNRPPIANCPFRVATEAFSPQDDRYRIQPGDLIILGPGAANTDPEARGDDVAPGNQAHLAFSIGPHECPGADLGRAITAVAVDRLLERLPDVQLANRTSWRVDWMARGLKDLPVRFTTTQVRPGRRASGSPAQAQEPRGTAPRETRVALSSV